VPRRRALLCVALLAAVLGLLAGPLAPAPAAQAQPRLTIEQAKAQLAELNRAAADAVEVLNGMKADLATATANVADRQAAVVAAERSAGAAGAVVDEMARRAYTSAGMGDFAAALSAGSPGEFLDRVAAVGEMNRVAANDLMSARDASSSVQTQQTALDQDQSILSEAVSATVAQQGRIDEAAAATKRLLGSLREEERLRIEAEAEAKRQTEMLAARAAAAGIPSLPATKATGPYAERARIAVAYMLSQVGGIYSMNAHPPATWDCSKLTAYAWGRAGVSLVPYSYSQWNQTDRVPLNQLQPGDLLFYFENGAHHVEMYIGNGQAVSASNPGVGVELQNDPFGGWYGDHFTGAGRVRL
jgi:cell wall-associated NlpC family hydrolase